MRQGNGTDLLGINDPRSASIGIIYVSPNDDRKSVLAAILTQEKLHRKQVVVVLPNQNKAFQRPQDFDDLRTIRRTLQAQIIFVAPGGPAEFARQKRFPVYASLEQYAQTLRNEDVVGEPAAEKRGWFGRGKPRNVPPTPAGAPGTPRPVDADDLDAVDADDMRQREEIENTPDIPPLAVSSGTVATAHAAQQAEDDKQEPKKSSSALKGGAIAAGGMLLGAGLAEAAHNAGQGGRHSSFPGQDDIEEGQFSVHPGDTQAIPPMHADDDQEDWDALPPAAHYPSATPITSRQGTSPGAHVNPGPSAPAPEDDDEDVFMTRSNPQRAGATPQDEDSDTLEALDMRNPPSRPSKSGRPDKITRAGAGAAGAVGGAAAAGASKPGDYTNGGANEGPAIIELPRRGSRRTVQLPQRDNDEDERGGGVAPMIFPEPTPAPTRGSKRQRNSGKMGPGAAGAAAGLAAGAALGAAAGTAGATGNAGSAMARNAPGNAPPNNALTRTGGGGGGMPPQIPGGGGRGGRRRIRPWWLLLVLLVLLGVFAALAIAYMSPNSFQPISKLLPSTQPAATITIAPDNKSVQDSYVIQAVTGTPDPNQRQVSLRQLNYTTPTQTKTVQATGQGHVPAKTASGTLTFSNGSGTSFTVAAGTTIPGSGGISVVTDSMAIIPAGNPAALLFGVKTVSAHASVAGTAGNIGPLTISGTCCSATNSIGVKNNNAFSGGQDQKTYTFLQQSDVNGVVNSMQDTLTQQAQQAFKGQVKPNEQLLDTPQCKPSSNVDQPTGDTGRNIPSATVSVSATCTGQAYDQQGVQTLVESLLQAKAGASPGAGYVLVGKIATQTNVQNQGANGLSLIASGHGIWAYKFSAAELQSFKQKVAGQSIKQAEATLKALKGVGNVNVQTTGTTLPTDVSQISLVIQSVTGLAGGNTPAAVNPASGTNSPASGPGTQNTPVPGKGSSDLGGGGS